MPLWVCVLKSLYFPDTDFSKAKRKRNDSWVWASLLHGKEVVMSSARWMVSNGNNIDIRNDKWLASGDIVEINENSVLRLVQDIIDPVTKSWDVYKIRNNFPAPTAFKILQTPMAWHCDADILWWPNAKSGEYFVKSGYFHLKKMKMNILFLQGHLLLMVLRVGSGRGFGVLKFLKK